MTDTSSTPAAEPAQYSVIATLPAGECDGADRVRRVGPYSYYQAADQAAAGFRMCIGSMPIGTEIQIGPYDPAVPHRNPRVTTSPSHLAEMIRDEPDGAGFPDLYDRLSAHAGHDEASRVWRIACSYLDAEAEAEAAERQAAAELEARLAPLRARIDSAAAFNVGSLYTAPIRDAAVWLLHDMLAAAEPRGVTLDDFAQVTDLPRACLNVVATMSISADRLPADKATAFKLLDALEAELVARGIEVACSGLTVQIPDERLPTAGELVAVTLNAGGGWELVLVDTGTRAARIFAPFDGTGTAAIADMIAEQVNRQQSANR